MCIRDRLMGALHRHFPWDAGHAVRGTRSEHAVRAHVANVCSKRACSSECSCHARGCMEGDWDVMEPDDEG
eukprot:5063686-Prorocentrum_lima.AAC.1